MKLEFLIFLAFTAVSLSVAMRKKINWKAIAEFVYELPANISAFIAKIKEAIKNANPPDNTAPVAAFLAITLFAGTAFGDVYARDFGFTPDNPASHQTPELQAAIDHCYDTGDHKLIVDPGKYTVRRTTIFPGIKIYGYGVTFNKLKGTHAYDVFFETYERKDYGRTVAKIEKGVGRTFNEDGTVVKVKDRDRNRYIWRGEGDSPLIVIRGFTFVGDAKDYDVSEYNSHQREHSHCVILSAADGPNIGPLTFHVQDVTCRDTTGNGFYFKSAKGQIKNYVGINCFRGVWSATRDVHLLAVNGVSYGRYGGIDVEPERGGSGLIIIDGLKVQNDFDIALMAGWEAYIKNVIALNGPINIVLRNNGKMVIENSRLDCGPNRKIEIRTIGKGSELVLNNVDLRDCPIDWIQYDSDANLLDFRKATNIGPISKVKVPPNSTNMLIMP